MRKFFLTLFFLFFFVSKTYAYESETKVLIINQIRGDEVCCQKGSLSLVEKIKENNLAADLSFGWALRYDALTNKQYLKALSGLGEFGLLLEVTPSLAEASQVVYKGKEDGSDWYYAKNAFLIGYSTSERKKLLDTLFASFKAEFGYYPKFTVAWMIDAWSLSYINQTYRVEFHEITKEQYETDSYTLYGGIFNAPYYPSKNHPLIPGYGGDKLNLLIVRQTVSDLLYNYGSVKAYFTSQPNDYLENPDGKDISYFRSLIENTLEQKSHFNLVLLGFENSLSWEKYGLEYIRQLNLIIQLRKEGKVKLLKAGDFFADFKKKNPENRPFYLVKDFFPGSKYGVLWFFGKTYRVRLIVKDGKVIIDDLRNFLSFEDPYKRIPVATDYAYWIIPYLIDGSQQYTIQPSDKQIIVKKDLLFGSTLSDKYTNPFGIVIRSDSFTLIDRDEEVEIKFFGLYDGSIKLLPDAILFSRTTDPYLGRPEDSFLNLFNDKKEPIFPFEKHFNFSFKKEGKEGKLGWLKDGQFIALFKLVMNEDNFSLSPIGKVANLSYLDPMFQPDRSDLPVDPKSSIFYWNNKKAIAGRNPVRLFILPLNSLKRPAKVNQVKVEVKDNSGVRFVYPQDYSFRISPWFIDINADNAVKTKVSVFIDGKEVIKEEQIEFIIDCRKKIAWCLTSWQQIIKYILLLLDDQKVKLLP